jgi:hypothetical protein
LNAAIGILVCATALLVATTEVHLGVTCARGKSVLPALLERGDSISRNAGEERNDTFYEPRSSARLVLPGTSCPRSYNVIVERNPFGLMPPPSEPPIPESVAAPSEDLQLTGLLGDLGSGCRAMFVVTGRGQLSSQFTMREGQTNEWLEILSIDPGGGIVRAILKQPCTRIRTVGAEVLLSFATHGRKDL